MRWLCVAHEKEISNFRNFTGGGFTAVPLAVGQFAALAEFSRRAAKEKPASVILFGTCGALDTAHLGKIFSVQHFAYPSILHEELPEFLERYTVVKSAIVVPDLPSATILQNHGISLDAEKFISNQGYIPPTAARPILENMEAATLAFACRALAIPFSAFMCVTNTIGPNGRAEWRKNFREAGHSLGEFIEHKIIETSN